MKRALAIFLCVCVVMLSSCGGKPDNGIDASVLAAWEGRYSPESRAQAIAEYEKTYIPVYAVNVDGDHVHFSVDFDAVSCGKVMLSPIANGDKSSEADTVVDFYAQAELDGNSVIVDIGWWNESPVSTQKYTVWSYLLWVKDSDGVNHYYYFRVDHST